MGAGANARTNAHNQSIHASECAGMHTRFRRWPQRWFLMMMVVVRRQQQQQQHQRNRWCCCCCCCLWYDGCSSLGKRGVHFMCEFSARCAFDSTMNLITLVRQVFSSSYTYYNATSETFFVRVCCLSSVFDLFAACMGSA